MQKETIMTLIRTALTLIGSYLIGKKLFGADVDGSIVETLVGAGLALFSIAWGILSKELGIEMLQSLIRQVVTAVGGILVAGGKLQPDKMEALTGFILAAASLAYSILSRKKSAAIAQGKIRTENLVQ